MRGICLAQWFQWSLQHLDPLSVSGMNLPHLLLIGLPANAHPGRQQMTAQVPGSLLPRFSELPAST